MSRLDKDIELVELLIETRANDIRTSIRILNSAVNCLCVEKQLSIR